MDEKIFKQLFVGMAFFMFVIFMLVFFGGCAKQEKSIVYETIEVKVPISEIPKIKPVYMPEIPINYLNGESEAGEIVSAYYNSIELLKKHITILEIQLRPFWNEYLKTLL
jgi:hypothetical protein